MWYDDDKPCRFASIHYIKAENPTIMNNEHFYFSGFSYTKSFVVGQYDMITSSRCAMGMWYGFKKIFTLSVDIHSLFWFVYLTYSHAKIGFYFCHPLFPYSCYPIIQRKHSSSKQTHLLHSNTGFNLTYYSFIAPTH